MLLRALCRMKVEIHKKIYRLDSLYDISNQCVCRFPIFVTPCIVAVFCKGRPLINRART